MSRRLLRKGDRIRLKHRTMFGWKGIGIVTENQMENADVVWFAKEGENPEDCMYGRNVACSYEVILIRSCIKAQSE